MLFSLVFGAAVARAADGDGGVGRRVALVVGNSNYANPQLVLSNPKNDAEDVSAALGALGFDVVSATDLSLASFDTAVATFKEKAKGAEVALFFYAGHAVQSDHVNYFIPVDANITQETQLRRGAISLDDVQAALAGVQGVQVLILDSCRDNPFSTLKSASRSLTMSRGLERITVTSGDSVVLYSTRANDVASDGASGARNSPFSRVLLDVLKRPGEHNLREMLWDVAAKVKAESGGKQAPELTMSLSGDYLFNLVNDRIEWDAVRTSLDPRTLRAYAARFPQSPFRKQAEQYAAVLEQQQLARRRDADAKSRKADEARVADEAVRNAKQKADDAARICWENYQKLDLLRTGRDRGGLERLAHDNTCTTLQTQIDGALASLTDADRRQACEKVETEISDYTQARNAAGLKAIQGDASACPGLGDRIAQAVVSLDVAERQQRDAEVKRLEAERQQALCDQDAGRLAALVSGSGPRRIDDIAAVGASSKCDKVRNDALALAGDLRRQEAQAAHDAKQRAACAAEAATVRDATDKGARAPIEALGSSHDCETLDVPAALAQFDDRMKKRRQEAAKACASIDVAGLASREDEKALADVSAKCPGRADEVAEAVAGVQNKRRVAEACGREGDELQRLVGARQGAAVTALGGRAICPSLDIPGALATIAAANCQTGLKAMVGVRDDDEAGLRAYAGNGELCADLRNRAQARLDTLLTARRDDAACDSAVADARSKGDLAGLKGLLARDGCARRKDVVARAIDDETRKAEQVRLAQVACDKVTASVGALAATDEGGLRRVVGDANACPAAKTAATAKLDVLAGMRRDDAACDAAVSGATSRGDLAALKALQGDPGCVRRRDVVARAVDGEQRKAEQARLAKAACDDAVGKVGALAAGDEASLRRVAGDPAACPAAKTAAAAKMDALLAMRGQDAACDGAMADAIGRGDVDALRKVGDDPVCVRRHDAVATALAAEQRKAEQVRLAAADCDHATMTVGTDFADDEGSLRRLSTNDAVCPTARTAAATRLDQIVAQHDEVDRGCETATRAAADAVDVERITQLIADPTCARRRPLVAAALKTATTARTTDGQQRLAGLGCFTGRVSGVFDAATGQAVGRYLNAKHVAGAVPTLFSADLIRDLSAESTQVCVQEARLTPDTDTAPTPPQAVEPPAPPKVVAPTPSTRNSDEEDDQDSKPIRKKRKPAPVAAEPPKKAPPRVVAQPDFRRERPVVRERPVRPEPPPPVTTQSSEPKAHIFFN